MMRDVISVAGFSAVVAVGLWVIIRGRGDGRTTGPPGVIHLVLVVTLGMSLLAGASGRDLWPFSSWRLMYTVLPAEVSVNALVCVDSAGRTFPVDHRAWNPLTEEELFSWLLHDYPNLDSAQMATARSTLHAQAEAARQRARLGESPAARPSLFGRWAASSHMIHPRIWNDAGDTPATPCASLRAVVREWDVDAMASGRDSIRESTLWEHPLP